MGDPMDIPNSQAEYLSRSPFLGSSTLPFRPPSTSPTSDVHSAPSDVHSAPSDVHSAPSDVGSIPYDVHSACSSDEAEALSSFSTGSAVSLPEKLPIQKEKIAANRFPHRKSPSTPSGILLSPSSSKAAPVISLLESPVEKEQIVATSSPSDVLVTPSAGKAAPVISLLESAVEKEQIVADSLERNATGGKSTANRMNRRSVSFREPLVEFDKLPPSKRKLPPSFQVESPVYDNNKPTWEKSPATTSNLPVSMQVEPPVTNDKPTLEKSTVTSSKLPASVQVESPEKMQLAEGDSPEQESPTKGNTPEEESSEKRKPPGHDLTEPMPLLSIIRRSKYAKDPEFPRDIFDVVKAIVEDRRERRPVEDVPNILDVARTCGISFPSPNWHRPGGYGDGGASSSLSQPVQRASGGGEAKGLPGERREGFPKP